MVGKNSYIYFYTVISEEELRIEERNDRTMKTFHMILQSTWFFPAPPFQVTRCTRSTNNESFPWPYDHAFNQTFQRIRSLSRQETRVGMFGWKEMRREQIQISPIKTKLQSIQAFKSLLIIGEIIYCAWKKKLRIYKR